MDSKKVGSGNVVAHTGKHEQAQAKQAKSSSKNEFAQKVSEQTKAKKGVFSKLKSFIALPRVKKNKTANDIDRIFSDMTLFWQDSVVVEKQLAEVDSILRSFTGQRKKARNALKENIDLIRQVLTEHPHIAITLCKYRALFNKLIKDPEICKKVLCQTYVYDSKKLMSMVLNKKTEPGFIIKKIASRYNAIMATDTEKKSINDNLETILSAITLRPLNIAVLTRESTKLNEMLNSSKTSRQTQKFIAKNIEPLTIAMMAEAKSFPTLVKNGNMLLLKELLKGSKTTEVALFQGCENNSTVLTNLILKNGKVSKKNGSEGFMLAMRYHNSGIMNELLDGKVVRINDEILSVAQKLLGSAVSDGDEKMVQALLRLPGIDVNAKINIQDKGSYSLLSAASLLGYTGIADSLLKCSGIKINQDSANDSPFVLAMRNGHEQIATKIFRNRRFDFNKIRKNNFPVLSWAVQHGSNEILALLLTKKHDINMLNTDGYTLLEQALLAGNKSAAELLLKVKGINVNIGKVADTLLYKISEQNNTSLAELILKKCRWGTGDEISPKNPPVLVKLCHFGNKEVVKLFIDSGKFNINGKDSRGRSPLIRACYDGHEEIVALLLKTDGIGVNDRDFRNNSALNYALKFGYENIVKQLMEHQNIALEEKDDQGNTLLIRLCRYGKSEKLMNLLLNSNKIDVNAKNEDGMSAFAIACRFGSWPFIEPFLKNAMVDVNSQNASGVTPLMQACLGTDERMVRKLLAGCKNFDINSLRDNKGWTALDYARKFCSDETVQLLLKYEKDQKH